MITEAMLCEAAHKASEVYTAYCERDYDPEKQYVLPLEFEKRIERLKRRANHPVFYKAMRRVASIALAFLIAGGAWLAVDTDARAAVVGWVKEIYETYFVYHFEGSSSKTETPVAYHLTLIPDGYTEFFMDDTTETVFVVYSNENGQLLKFNYAQDPNETDWFITTNQMVVEEITVNGVPAELITSTEPDAASAIVWIAGNNTAFNVSGFFDVEDLIAIAESVQPIISYDRIADVASEPAAYRLEWIPDDYTEIYADDDSDGGSALYENADGKYLQFIYIVTPDESNLFVENTDATKHSITVNGQPGDYIKSNNPDISDSVVWANERDHLFYVSGYFDEAELIQIAESVHPIINYDGITDVASEPAEFKPTWLPDGYSECRVNASETRTVVVYANDAGEMIRFNFIHDPDKTDWFIDVSQANIKSATVNGNKADLLIAQNPDEANGIAWVSADTAFYVTGFIDENDLVKIAESVQQMK